MRIGSRTYECTYGLFRRHSTRQRSALSAQFCNFGANIACKRMQKYSKRQKLIIVVTSHIVMQRKKVTLEIRK